MYWKAYTRLECLGLPELDWDCVRELQEDSERLAVETDAEQGNNLPAFGVLISVTDRVTVAG
jgi:hypothetical protein